ncbi:MAG: ribulose-phosphate 3-epimerase [Clostridia bacterium]|nr:ribulose-phosphate 3-epimerase [Clostridia bacterium]
MIKVSPSLLSADFANMENACKMLEQAGADYIHCDVMDGSFVSQITFGEKMVAAVKNCSNLPLDVHLMIVNPMEHIESFAKAGSSIITVHYEALKDKTEACIKAIKALGVKAGLSVKPNTDIMEIEKYLPMLDLVLIMSVEPGKGGQSFMDSALVKIEFCKKYKTANNLDLLIEVDGGINDKTGELCAKAGVDVLVAGSYVFKGKDIKGAISSLKAL